jgi:uncharacterized membrane protein
VNTLAIAYVGAALPILLLFYTSLNSTVTSTLNSEIVATEIVRILIGSIGLVVAVPITTAIAVAWIVRPHAAPTQPGLLAEETRALDGVEHHHG